MHIVILETDLFPDKKAMENALAALERVPAAPRLSRYDLREPGMTDGDWDAILDAILVSDVVVTL
ncbi:MAG: hypothetical protein ACYDEV_02495 [Acidiferrobacter sp.]